MSKNFKNFCQQDLSLGDELSNWLADEALQPLHELSNLTGISFLALTSDEYFYIGDRPVRVNKFFFVQRETNDSYKVKFLLDKFVDEKQFSLLKMQEDPETIVFTNDNDFYRLEAMKLLLKWRRLAQEELDEINKVNKEWNTPFVKGQTQPQIPKEEKKAEPHTATHPSIDVTKTVKDLPQVVKKVPTNNQPPKVLKDDYAKTHSGFDVNEFINSTTGSSSAAQQTRVQKEEGKKAPIRDADNSSEMDAATKKLIDQLSGQNATYYDIDD
jgi:hypothetical protein